MISKESTVHKRRRRVAVLLLAFALLLVSAIGVRWWLVQPVVLEALTPPPLPESTFAQAIPEDPPLGGTRLRSEPLIEPFQFAPDPLRRKIRGFELIYPGPVANTFTGTVYFDTREPIFNAFGDESFSSNQLAEAHAARFNEVPREELEAGLRSLTIFGREHSKQLSKTKRLFEVVFAQGESPRQFWFVHDSSPAADHFLWVARKSMESTPSATMGGHRADLGLRLFGAPPAASGTIEQPMRLSGYRGLVKFGMMQLRVEAGADNTATVTLDPNRHSVDVFGDPSGSVTLMAYASLVYDMSPVEQSDPTGQNRRILRLTPQEQSRGWFFRWGVDSPMESGDHFDLILSPASNGRHRLLIWQQGQLRNVVHLQDELARRRGKLAERLQSVPQSEREAVQALHASDPESRVTIKDERVIGLSVTRLSAPETVAGAIRALLALEGITLYGGTLTAEIAEVLAGLQNLKSLSCSGCGIDEEAFMHFGRLRQLESLNIRQTERFQDAAMKYIETLTNLTALTINREFRSRPDNWRELVLSEQGVSRVTSLQQLTHLDLHGQNVTDSNCQQLASLSHLKFLALSGENLTDVGLAALKPLTNLTRLHLWDVAITPEGAEAFKRPGLDFNPGPFGKEHD